MPLPPGCRVVDPDPCTGRGTIVCPDAGNDVFDVVADAVTDACRVECPMPPPGCRYEGPITCSPRSCGTLVCTDAGLDAVPGDVADAGLDAVSGDVPDGATGDASGDAAIVCGAGGGSFPTFRQDCAQDSDCIVAVHQTDCCGNQRGLGLHRSQREAFDAAEAICRPMYPRCGCPTRGILCDDERWTFDPSSVGVACRSNRCTTFVR